MHDHALIEQLNLNWIMDVWHSSMDLGFWQMLLIGLFFLSANFGICAAMWLMRRGMIREVVFSKRNRKFIKKKTAAYSVLDQIFLFRLASETHEKRLIVYVCLVFNMVNIASFLVCCVGFFGALITLAEGWALSLLVFPCFAVMILSAIFEFVPGIVLIPSIGRKYGLHK